MDVISATILLILVLDPFGNIPLVLATLGRVDEDRQRRVILRECTIAYIVLLCFLFPGRPLLEIMRLSETAIGIAGGVILFLIALRMVFHHPEGPLGDGTSDNVEREPYIVPLAIPAIAGPSALATVIVMTSRDPQRWPEWMAAISLAMIVSVIVLLLATRISRCIGRRGVNAMERLMGLILTAIAVEMLLHGITAYVRSVGG